MAFIAKGVEIVSVRAPSRRGRGLAKCLIQIPKVIFVIGGPGCGKGTQCQRIATDSGFRQLTMGELLRLEAQSSSSLGVTIKAMIDQGTIVPGSLAIQILRKELERVVPQGLEGVLLDGFPRNIEQMEEYEKAIGQFDHALYFDVNSEVLRQRLLQRSVSSDRVDDVKTVIERRLKTFADTGRPLLDYFQRRGKLSVVDGNLDIESVYKETKEVFERVVHGNELEGPS
eukprot:CAMPEP_0184745476 /NCGR_PEP_ID=MMETSP0315-20130426/8142_1 /TAXON_ID=101924 /ORGANISM="Rhodosorus marinus, Strain UTEX LB 2760" /LENGTH=227 /DNA_ID=CAMNT_0027217641 /DNA_START=343 /DNA_END=1026 /DNA_ORIENTATION=+